MIGTFAAKLLGRLTTWLYRLGDWFAEEPKRLLYVFGAIILVVAIWFLYSIKYTESQEDLRKIQDAQIEQMAAELELLRLKSQDKVNAQAVLEAEAKEKEAEKNLVEVTKKAAGSYSDKYLEVRQKFCADHPEDCK